MKVTVDVKIDRSELRKMIQREVDALNTDVARAIATNTVCEVLAELAAGADEATEMALRQKFTLIGPKVVKAVLEYHGVTDDAQATLLADAGSPEAGRDIKSGS